MLLSDAINIIQQLLLAATDQLHRSAIAKQIQPAYCFNGIRPLQGQVKKNDIGGRFGDRLQQRGSTCELPRYDSLFMHRVSDHVPNATLVVDDVTEWQRSCRRIAIRLDRIRFRGQRNC
jgi:hypothetical protein